MRGGVLLPKTLLETWGVHEGDHLELSERGLRPPRRPGSSQEILDERKRLLAVAVVREFSPRLIRARASLICTAGKARARGSQPTMGGNRSWKGTPMVPCLSRCWAVTRTRIDCVNPCPL